MDHALPLALLASKLPTVSAVSTLVVIIGLAVFVASWIWLIFQNYRFSPVHGILSIIPIWALLYGFFRMEHSRKDIWISACVAGLAVAILGGMLFYSARACDANSRCLPSRNVTVEEPSTTEEPQSSLLLEPMTDRLPG